MPCSRHASLFCHLFQKPRPRIAERAAMPLRFQTKEFGAKPALCSLSDNRKTNCMSSLTASVNRRQWLRDATVLPPRARETVVLNTNLDANRLLASLPPATLEAITSYLKL